MLGPREADVPGLLVALVVLPLVAYFLLGKWKEALEKKERIRILAELASEEALRAASSPPPSPPSDSPIVGSPFKASLYVCARCFGPATTRCSRCKSVRYCSGKCQIVHWRQGHKDECQQLDISFTNSVPKSGSPSPVTTPRDVFLKSDIKSARVDAVFSTRPSHSNATADAATNMPHPLNVERKLSDSEVDLGECLKTRSALGTTDKPSASDSIKTSLEKESGPVHNCDASASLTDGPCEASRKVETKRLVEMVPQKPTKEIALQGSSKVSTQSNQSPPEISCSSEILTSKRSSSQSHQPKRTGQATCQKTSDSASGQRKLLVSLDKDGELKSSKLEQPCKGRTVSECSSNMSEAKLHLAQKSDVRKYPIAEAEKIGINMDSKNSKTSVPITASPKGTTDTLNLNDKTSPRKPLKHPLRASAEDKDCSKKSKMLFPYEDFVKFFDYDGLELSPRGLLNCGNSCYANAILQCLTYTKPLITYLLQRCHSRTCCVRDWCLTCELEQHVLKLREDGGPLSPLGLLSQLQIGGRMGSGSQEDAHEFLRLLIASMQSICLSGFGGEKNIDTRLQETTFIQQTFGGCLKSKVKCLKCQHESERYENIMDLTLEIPAWVESLEDALAQFTSIEDLDGENKYRCGRCSTYVRARKQLSIHEAPNVLTIVLKRFQTGKYGKITKCITFPAMLDMIPFMTGTGDSPPLYMLYGVVVHLDSLNASFSGHYVSYVKDLQDSWYRIDDTVVEPVPLSQVMSEGAYILFYARSCPRPPRVHTGKANALRSSASGNHCRTSVEKPPQNKHLKLPPPPYTKSSEKMENSSTSKAVDCHIREASNRMLPSRKDSKSLTMDFSDVTSSDSSSIFTSSDDGSFTTDSDRYSVSTMDHSETDAIFNSFNIPDHLHRATSCKMFPPCRMETRYFSERNAYVLDASMPAHLPGNVHTGKRLEQVGASLNESMNPGSNCSMSLRQRNYPKDGLPQTF
ncbi:Ubiquitin carboxyl-terminal hydrolase 15 [Nymphaea thermarum]|nr:Ubiquitin carboxyl-terminal hydrolase 15 [Nymphaea thermarum]